MAAQLSITRHKNKFYSRIFFSDSPFGRFVFAHFHSARNNEAAFDDDTKKWEREFFYDYE